MFNWTSNHIHLTFSVSRTVCLWRMDIDGEQFTVGKAFPFPIHSDSVNGIIDMNNLTRSHVRPISFKCHRRSPANRQLIWNYRQTLRQLLSILIRKGERWMEYPTVWSLFFVSEALSLSLCPRPFRFNLIRRQQQSFLITDKQDRKWIFTRHEMERKCTIGHFDGTFGCRHQFN